MNTRPIYQGSRPGAVADDQGYPGRCVVTQCFEEGLEVASPAGNGDRYLHLHREKINCGGAFPNAGPGQAGTGRWPGFREELLVGNHLVCTLFCEHQIDRRRQVRSDRKIVRREKVVVNSRPGGE